MELDDAKNLLLKIRDGGWNSHEGLQTLFGDSFKNLIRGENVPLVDSVGASFTLLAELLVSHIQLILKSENIESWETVPWPEMHFYVLLKARKVLQVLSMVGSPAEESRNRFKTNRQKYPGFEVSIFHQPCDFVGGDWADSTLKEGVLWSIVADVRGKSVPANMIASALPSLWRRTMSRSLATTLEVFSFLDGELRPCLPAGWFVDITVGRFEKVGKADLRFGSGGSGGYFRQSFSPARPIKGEGTLVGVLTGDPAFDIADWGSEVLQFGLGDELALASDGMHDQFPGKGAEFNRLLQFCLERPSRPTLYEAIVTILKAALENAAQFDDITVLSVRRLEEAL